MKPTDDLKEEHDAVKLMLRILDGICMDIDSGKKVDYGHLENIVEFMKVFVDKCHHTKEEAHLFPAMEKAGISVAVKLIPSLLQEHEEGREHVRKINEAVSGKMDSEALSTIVRNSRDYTQLLIRHIDKEDRYLFPVADARLKPETQENMLESFELVEAEKIGTGKHEEFHRMLRELEKIYVKP
ncbi:hemerythrin HHE cation-binding protein [Methanosarcina sp. KYL-1]|uniref:hemerythrin domain-containing protein n=1 Tax=Methanosarcina sp. KYL-1 TaxID=2602068 RepID=UPI0021017A3A|nr:hemerythrin domain-containing protein [Methanosarcina sp. KYL-1]MCQ1537386.1 hemerythrin HHE cation-binding protein [Methanosarcina sp. KYL-1]